MSGNEREKVDARLRKGHDDDLRKATAGIEAGELSELVRDGLRLMLGIRTKKQIEVKESPLAIPGKLGILLRAAADKPSSSAEGKQKTTQPPTAPGRPVVFNNATIRPNHFPQK